MAELGDRSGGNPLFIEELAALIRDSDGAIGADGARAFDSGDLPVTLRGLVAARLDALAAVDRAVLEDCAVVGSSGPVEAVVGLGDAQSLSGAERALSALADRDLVVLEDGEFTFKSELIREVAYGTLTKAERARRHAASRACRNALRPPRPHGRAGTRSRPAPRPRDGRRPPSSRSAPR